MFGGYFNHRRVLVTGHTGFKGSWLCEWLLEMGAVVAGYSLPPATEPALFDLLGLKSRLASHVEGDIRDLDSVCAAVEAFNPDVLFHLAAQPLVRDSYDRPVETYAVNVMGTVNVLEALRRFDLRCNAVLITTDKCYENREWVHSYREEDPMGGWDPYSSSKGCAELVIGAYRRSFFSATDSPVRLASARAGNVIGGGDWAKDRILPDCIRSLRSGDVISVRNRLATRPWQHVLEPLSGYLQLASKLAAERPVGALSSAFNFGPALGSNRTVEDLVVEVLRHWPGRWVDRSDPKAVHEAKLLNLATDKAHHFLGWSTVWPFEETVARSVQWYWASEKKEGNIEAFTRQQVLDYVPSARKLNLSWSH